MTVPTRRRSAAGFSLIELLVVVGLLAVLAAIGTGTYFRIRDGAVAKATEDTLAKATSGFMQIWSAELDNARDAFAGKPGYTQYAQQVENTKIIAGGDVDRARALWYYLWMKNAFPQTIPEATTATTLTVLVGATNVTVTLPARPTFAGMTPGTLGTADQAAALLYRILTQKGSRGQVYDEEAVGALSAKLPGTDYRIFTDALGSPISYLRFSSGNQNDMNSAENLKGTNPSRDPFDPAGRLETVSPATWPAARRTAVLTYFGFTDFTNNWSPTLVSRSKDKTWGTFAPAATGLQPVPNGYIYGYKLRRAGNRGDQ